MPNATWPPPSTWPRSPPPGSEALERIQDVRTDWLDRTREVQERAAFAGDELERRGLDRDTADPVGEQQELFTIGNGEPVGEAAAGADTEVAAGVAGDADTATSAAQTMRGLDPAQRQFDLDGVPPAVPVATASERVATEHQTTEHQTTEHQTTERRARDHRQRRSELRAGRGRRAAGRRRTGGQRHIGRTGAAARGRAGRVCRAVRPDRTGRRTGTGAARPVRGATHARRRRGRAATHRNDSPGDAASGRAVDTTAERTEDEADVEDDSLTVSQATRQAEIIADMRAELDARAGTVAGAPLPRTADPDDEGLDIGASRDDVDARTDVEQGQSLST